MHHVGLRAGIRGDDVQPQPARGGRDGRGSTRRHVAMTIPMPAAKRRAPPSLRSRAPGSAADADTHGGRAGRPRTADRRRARTGRRCSGAGCPHAMTAAIRERREGTTNRPPARRRRTGCRVWARRPRDAKETPAGQPGRDDGEDTPRRDERGRRRSREHAVPRPAPERAQRDWSSPSPRSLARRRCGGGRPAARRRRRRSTIRDRRDVDGVTPKRLMPSV